MSVFFLIRFCTFSLNVDSILPYTEVASDFQSEPLTLFTVISTTSISELVVVIHFNRHKTIFASWHIFTCHNALQLFKNSHNTKFRVVALSLMPQRGVVFFSFKERFRSLSLTYTNSCLRRMRRQTRHSCHRKPSKISCLSEHTKCVQGKYKHLQQNVKKVSYASFIEPLFECDQMISSRFYELRVFRVKRSVFLQSFSVF